jgi:hypothetical protein
MQVAPWGIHYTTRKLIVEPLDDAALGKAILDAYDSNRADLEAVQRATRGATLREAQRLTRDEGDPRSVGWTILLNKKDPDRAARLDAIQPLAKQRGWSGEPLYYNDEKPYEWYDWVSNSYSPLNAERPFYVLILGGPAQVPFLFQSFLATNAAVGRLDLEPDQARAYAEKVVRLEKAANLSSSAKRFFSRRITALIRAHRLTRRITAITISPRRWHSKCRTRTNSP